MENINVIPTITKDTTLAELLAILGPVTKAEKTPTVRKLLEDSGAPIATEDGCQIFANGYAVYDNGSGRTVMWIPDCVSFTYFFVQPKDTEIGIAPAKETLPVGYLESLPWPLVLTLIGDHRVEDNMMNRTGSRAGTKDYDSDDNGDRNGDAEEAYESSFRKEYFWRDGRFGENPEDAYIRKEELREALERMTEKQRRVFVLYYKYGYNQREIGTIMGIAQQNVYKLLNRALYVTKKIFEAGGCKTTSPTTVYERT